MSKIRVYELARELNLTNKALMEKLTGLNITVASHMSSLDDDAIQRVKAALFGKKEAAVEETRVKSTVIRRRKKVTEVQAEEAPAAEAPAEPPAEPAEPAASVAEPLRPSPKPPSRRRTRGPSTPHAGGPANRCACARARSGRDRGAPFRKSLRPAPRPNRPMAPLPPESRPRRLVTEKLRKGEKIVKKVKRDEPARIIKLPVAPVERTAEPARVRPKLVEPRGPKVAAAPVEIGPPAPGADDRDDKKRKKKWGTDEEAGKKFIKKKISFRTKAVVEAEDLYDEGSRSRKPRKGGKAQPEVASHKSQVTVAKAIKRRIKMDEAIVLSELAKRMGVKAGEIIKVLMGMGVMATVNQSIDFDTVVLIAAEFNYEAERTSFEEDTLLEAGR